MGGILL